MALNDAILNIGAAAMQTAAAYAAIHTAEPNGSGSNESTAAREAIVWDTPAGGDMVLDAALEFTGGASGGPATHIGFWSASSGGTFYGWYALSGDQTFNAAGEYSVPTGTIAGTSS